MRGVILACVGVLAATPAAAQSTFCTGGASYVWCNTTPAPAPNPGLAESEANFGAALGGMFAEAAARAQERRQAREDIRNWAYAAIQQGNCPLALAYAGTDKNLRADVERVCAAQRDGELERQVHAFAIDPAHPRFQELHGRMAELVQSGRANTIQEAYDMAAAEAPSGSPQ